MSDASNPELLKSDWFKKDKFGSWNPVPAKELKPSRVGICRYCNVRYPQLLEGVTV